MTPDNEFVTNPQVSKFKIAPGAEPVPGYRLVEQLGKGGFGEVWRALGPGGVPVALKLVSLDEGGKVEERAMEVIKSIRHPHLLPVFGIWRKNKWLIVAMELADRTLLDRYKEAVGQGFPGIPAPEIHEHFADAARGLDYLNEPRHVAGADSGPMAIQHRDIKPQNILLVGGCSKVADFGLARVLEGSTSGHSGSMTPTYAAPEFFAGKTSSHSDQYSLAVTYCHLRGGRPPFTGTIQEVMMAHVHNPPDLSMVPENERPAVARALSKNPKDRWPSCRAFVDALKTNTASLPVTLPWTSGDRLKRKRILLAASLALMILAIVTAAIARFWRPSDEGEGDLQNESVSNSRETDDAGTSETSQNAPASASVGNWALEFDGIDDRVRTDLQYGGLHPVTFEAVLTPSAALRGTILGTIRTGESLRSGRGIGLSIGPGGRLAMLMKNEDKFWAAASESPLQSGQRIHVAGRFAPKTRRLELFIDGVLQADTEATGLYHPIPQPILIGDNYSKAPGPDRAFSGQMEWVRVSRILRDFDGTKVPMDPPKADAETLLLLDFTKGKNYPPVVVPEGGQVVIDGPTWIERK